MISIFTTYTDPGKRMDPWKEALNCYKDFADEVIITGENWKEEFRWKEIGETFQEGFDSSTNDWVIRMDIDYFFHQNDKRKLLNALKKSNDYPAIALPQYQFFTADRFHMKTRLCVVLNKKKFPNIKLNGGGDYCLATLDNKLITPNNVPNFNIPIYQYDSMFRTKEIIAADRARFARAWFREFGEYGSRGGPNEKEAFEAWIDEIKLKYSHHTNKFNINHHPIYIIEKLKNLSKNQFGFDMFGNKNKVNKSFKKYVKGKKELYLGTIINNKLR